MADVVIWETFLSSFSLSPAHELASLCVQQTLQTILIHTSKQIGLRWGSNILWYMHIIPKIENTVLDILENRLCRISV